MSLDFAGPLSYLESIVDDFTSVQDCILGAPKSLAVQKTVYIGVGGFTIPDKYGGTVQLDWRIQLYFAHALEGNERAAELAVAAFLAEFIPAILADRSLGGTVASARIDGSLADDPLYSIIGAEEVRLYPVVIGVTQRQQYANQNQ